MEIIIGELLFWQVSCTTKKTIKEFIMCDNKRLSKDFLLNNFACVNALEWPWSYHVTEELQPSYDNGTGSQINEELNDLPAWFLVFYVFFFLPVSLLETDFQEAIH